jgi:hypothetical protein
MVVQTSAHAEAVSQPEPLLPVFAVRAELAPYTDISFFDQQVGAAIEYGARTGDFSQLRKGLRGWLHAALSAKHVGELTGKPIAERSQILARLMRQWQDEHPAQELYR